MLKMMITISVSVASEKMFSHKFIGRKIVTRAY